MQDFNQSELLNKPKSGNFNNYQMPNYQLTQKCKYKWWIAPLSIFGAIVLAGITFFLILIGIGSSFGESFNQKEVVDVKENTILFIDFANLNEISYSNPGNLFGSKSLRFYDALKAINNAANDDNIKGIYYKAPATELGKAKAAELQQALINFKNSKKFIYAFIESGSTNQYFNALPADSIFMPTEGILMLNSFSSMTFFWKGLYDKIGLKFNVIQFEDFKSYGETYNRTSFSDSAKAEIRHLLSARMNDFVEKVSYFRKIDKGTVIKHLTEGIFSADEALEGKYIDAIISEAELRSMLKEKTGGKLRFLSLDRYASAVNVENFTSKNKIAIINAEGAIQSGSNMSSPFSQNQGIYSGDLVKIIRKVREDANIKGVILRINSPGGSVIASDEIAAELELLRKKKPLYASMSDVAASGGYWLALACDSIYAQPETITGSIGVVAVLPNISGVLKKLDITYDTVNTTSGVAFEDMLISDNSPMLERFKKSSEKVYFRFLNKTAKKRGMTFNEARNVAKGRVWTGADAFQRNLVDCLDNLNGVIFRMNERLNKKNKSSDEHDVVIYPMEKDEITEILEMFTPQYDEEEATAKVGISKDLVSNAFGTNSDLYYMAKKNLPKSFNKQIDYMINIFKIAEKENILMMLPHQLD